MSDILPPAQGTPLEGEYSNGTQVIWTNPSNTSLKERGKVLFYDSNTGMCVIKESGFLGPIRHLAPADITRLTEEL